MSQRKMTIVNELVRHFSRKTAVYSALALRTLQKPQPQQIRRVSDDDAALGSGHQQRVPAHLLLHMALRRMTNPRDTASAPQSDERPRWQKGHSTFWHHIVLAKLLQTRNQALTKCNLLC